MRRLEASPQCRSEQFKALLRLPTRHLGDLKNMFRRIVNLLSEEHEHTKAIKAFNALQYLVVECLDELHNTDDVEKWFQLRRQLDCTQIQIQVKIWCPIFES